MTHRVRTSSWIATSVFCLAGTVYAGVPATLTVHADKPGPAISPTLYGLMTEEINHSYDGGLYAELVRNRSFQDDAEPKFWSLVQAGGGKAAMSLDKTDPVNANLPVSLKLTLGGGRAGVANDGFWGVPVKPDTTYTASFYAKAADGFNGTVRASIVTDAGEVVTLAETTEKVGGAWKKFTVPLATGSDTEATSKAKFVLSAEGTGTVSFSLVSLFPPTYQDRANGLRPDLIQKMQAMRPTFLRFPGGNYLEGDTFDTRFDWKKQIGKIEDRPGHMGCWGYRSSDGLGMPEFLHWCRAVNAEPVLGVFAGYVLKGQYVKAGPELQKYVDEALEEIEYVTGGPDTKWGKQRIADGNPEPFKLRYVEVGNEDWFDRSGSYDGRFAQFYDAIKAKYPEIQVIATMPVNSRKPDLLDDHYYRSPRAMAADIGHYDKADRSGPKIFVGEWASQDGRPTPTLHSALGDAAWLLGLERNSDHVVLSCYAPMLVNVNNGAWQWGTNLIGYDAMSSFGSPSYYAQVMLADHKGDTVLPADLVVKSSGELPLASGAVGVGTWNTQAEFKDVVVTPAGGKATTFANTTDGYRILNGDWAAKDGVIAQTKMDTGCVAFIGDTKWTDYTVRLKARKTGGDEGFLVAVRATGDRDFVWWNLGGWGNTRTALEASVDGDRREFGRSAEQAIETGKWYDLRVEVVGRNVKCFVDNKLVSQGQLPAATGTPVYAGASYDKASGDVILKVVNMTADEVDADVKLDGVSNVASDAKVVVLTGDQLDAVNTVTEPTKIVPKEGTFGGTGEAFKRTFAPRSLTIVRVKAATK